MEDKAKKSAKKGLTQLVTCESEWRSVAWSASGEAADFWPCRGGGSRNNDRGWKEDERPVMLMSTNLRWDCGWSRCIIPHFKDKGFGEEGNEPKG